MKKIIDQLILTAGAWQSSGGTDKVLERQFGRQLKELSWITNTSMDGALELFLAHLAGNEAEAC